jgi:hypothetical protein
VSIKIGIIDLCTSHPSAFVPILREYGCEITAVYDSGQTRSAEFLRQFAQEKNIPHICSTVEEMVPLVDAVTIHGADWDTHIDRAKPFVESGKYVCIDKPMVGRVGDVDRLLGLDRRFPNRIFGGSSCVFVEETLRLAQAARVENDRLVTALASGPNDLFSYGIHTVELLQAIVGYDAESVTCLSAASLGNYLVHFARGIDAHLHLHTPHHAWFAMINMARQGVITTTLDTSKLYRALLRKFMDFCKSGSGLADWSLSDALQPILTAIAMQKSSAAPGQPIRLSSLAAGDGFSGNDFARRYSLAREQGKMIYKLEEQVRWEIPS